MPYSRQMVSYDEQGRQSVVTFEVSKDGKNYSPFWITTYKYDPVVQSFVTEQKTLMWNADSAAYVLAMAAVASVGTLCAMPRAEC